MISSIEQHFRSRSAIALMGLENRLDRILQWWLLLAGCACAARVGFSPHPNGIAALPLIGTYLLVVVAPFASTLLALRWFRDGHLQPQPTTRLARFASWRTVDPREAMRHPLYGTSGIMVSLLVGMMLNVPVRTAEYLASMPPLVGAPPKWLATLHFMMTFDVVVFSSLYMIAFVAALRRVPLFPQLLVAIWACDLAMQVATAKLVVAAGPLPPAVSHALAGMMEGNVKKVLISAGLWLPYLLLSKRVNVTYRHRVPA